MGSLTVSLKLYQLRVQAKRHPERVFTTLHHLIDVEFLAEAYRRTKKDAAAGVDEVSGEDYAVNLEANLQSLYTRYKEGNYVAPFVRRVWIGKEDGSQRPIGIPAFEDKILQRAVAMILGAIHEIDFYDFSYGFRENRSAHQAIKSIRDSCYKEKVSVIIDADVSEFFDNMPHDRIREILKLRINDGHILRIIGKWLKAGVVEDGKLHYPACGSPQGGVISPLIANIFLHHVLDEWFVEQAKPKLNGRSFLVRYADDFVLGCENAEDAERLMRVLPKRFAKFGLSIHPDKSKMIDFKWPSKLSDKSRSGTFDFLGFTHYWGRSRSGHWVIKRQTMKKRQSRAMRDLYQYCRQSMHDPVAEQFRKLSSKLHGLYNYYGIIGNYRALWMLYEHVRRIWLRWLGRRTRNGYISWKKGESFLRVWQLPRPQIRAQV
ncbi:MAG: group II intron reverse transcriptase/maturase [Pseudomonadales bacterium]|nr:group II intron reverse transcriptase/maturase [Pseudomonadales bacterium]